MKTTDMSLQELLEYLMASPNVDPEKKSIIRGCLENFYPEDHSSSLEIYLDGKKYDVCDIADIDWDGCTVERDYRDFEAAEELIVETNDGEVYFIDPKTLDYKSWYWLGEWVLPR